MKKNYRPLRQFIFDRLYHPKDGYFCKKDFQVGQLKSPIDFKKLFGFDDYQKQLFDKYPKNAWLTPCQIFKPYYGMTISNYIRQAHQKYEEKRKFKDKLRIVEAGAGTGSAAQSIIFFLQNYYPNMLQNFQYTIVQISPTLCKKTEQKLSKSYSKLMKNNSIKIINDDIVNYKTKDQTFMLFFQVLDNMPHDKVIWNQINQKFDNFVSVDIDSKQQSLTPIEKDIYVQRCLQLYLKSKNQIDKNKPSSFKLSQVSQKIANYIVDKYMTKKKNSKNVFLPTYFYKVMQSISKNTPDAHMIISDFDHLISQVQGINSPIVSQKGQGSAEKKDFSTLFVQRGQADIFFPVDFNLAKSIHKQLLKKNAITVKSHQFIDQFSYQKWANTKSNFNPIKEDFGNTSFLVTDINN